VGALVGAGIPKEKAQKYSEDLDRGGILLGVYPRPENRDEKADAAFIISDVLTSGWLGKNISPSGPPRALAHYVECLGARPEAG
jgi:hypothetical protein